MKTIAATTISRLASPVDLRDFIPAAADGPFAALLGSAPWDITSKADAIIRRAIGGLAGYLVQDGVAVHRTATVEPGAVVPRLSLVDQRPPRVTAHHFRN